MQMYALGRGVKQNSSKTIELHRKAALQGHKEAIFMLEKSNVPIYEF